MTKCTCYDFRREEYKKRETKVYNEIDKRIAKMDEAELRKEIRPLMRYKIAIISFPCLCDDEEIE